jgi:hypothetical protein
VFGHWQSDSPRLDADFSAADVASRADVTIDTVRRAQPEMAVTHSDDKQERRFHVVSSYPRGGRP